ncbi:MAG: hypothetical protein KIT34_14110 [Cyanobacteria bacterium TGS_CYA1]|nr:hypothetical protein [Cyanobacteria bacterium TGS_CYA1]
MKNNFLIPVATANLILFSLSSNRCFAQSMYNTIRPVFSGTKAVGKPISVKISSGKKYGLTYPKAGDTYQIGTYIPVNPSPGTAGEEGFANYYLVDNHGAARLVYVQGGMRCGNDLNRVEFPKGSIWGIKIEGTENGEVIPAQEYTLVITKGGRGESARTITGDIIARSGKFNLANIVQTPKRVRITGTVTLPPFDSRLKLPANAREEFFKKAMPIYLTSQNHSQAQIEIHADKNGAFDAIIPAGNYTLQAGTGENRIDNHRFFFDHHLTLTPTKETKITVQPGDSYQINYTLRDDNAGANFRDGYMDYTIQAGALTKK